MKETDNVWYRPQSIKKYYMFSYNVVVFWIQGNINYLFYKNWAHILITVELDLNKLPCTGLFMENTCECKLALIEHEI